MKNPIEPCQICGDIGFEELIMTCRNCRETREHIYCARVLLFSTPDRWLCEVCRSSPGLINQSRTVDHPIPDTNKASSLVSNDSSSSKKQRSQFLAFPSPKRKRRTPRVPVEELEEEAKCQRLKSPPLCGFHSIN